MFSIYTIENIVSFCDVTVFLVEMYVRIVQGQLEKDVEFLVIIPIKNQLVIFLSAVADLDQFYETEKTMISPEEQKGHALPVYVFYLDKKRRSLRLSWLSDNSCWPDSCQNCKNTQPFVLERQ